MFEQRCVLSSEEIKDKITCWVFGACLPQLMAAVFASAVRSCTHVLLEKDSKTGDYTFRDIWNSPPSQAMQTNRRGKLDPSTKCPLGCCAWTSSTRKGPFEGPSRHPQRNVGSELRQKSACTPPTTWNWKSFFEAKL